MFNNIIPHSNPFISEIDNPSLQDLKKLNHTVSHLIKNAIVALAFIMIPTRPNYQMGCVCSCIYIHIQHKNQLPSIEHSNPTKIGL